MNRLAAVAAIAVLASCAGVAHAGQTKYVMTDLGALNGDPGGVAYSINDSSVIVGASTGASDTPFLYSHGVMHDLSGFMPPSSIATEPYSINNAGQIVGVTTDGFTSRAFSLNQGVYTDLGTLGGSEAFAFRSNNSGVIVGSSLLKGDVVSDGFIYQNGQMTDLTGFGGDFTSARGINDAGAVAGFSYLTGTVVHAFSYVNGVMTDIGTLGGSSSEAFAINSLGQIAGDSDLAGNAGHHPFIYNNGVMIDLGSLGGPGGTGFANSINDQGDVVGMTDDPTSPYGFTAFLYHHGVMTNINNLIVNGHGLYVTFASWINGKGQVVGAATTKDGIAHAVLLTPLDAVPEPSTWAMMIAGLASVGAALRRGRRAIRRHAAI